MTQSKQELDINRDTYDHHNEENLNFKAKPGITEEIVRKISSDKNEPEWMLEKRLFGLKIFQEKEMPRWGPDLSELDLSKIVYYMKQNDKKNYK